MLHALLMTQAHEAPTFAPPLARKRRRRDTTYALEPYTFRTPRMHAAPHHRQDTKYAWKAYPFHDITDARSPAPSRSYICIEP